MSCRMEKAVVVVTAEEEIPNEMKSVLNFHLSWSSRGTLQLQKSQTDASAFRLSCKCENWSLSQQVRLQSSTLTPSLGLSTLSANI